MPEFKYLPKQDPEIFSLIEQENERQQNGLELIPSENHTSPAVLEALATTLSDKYAEGYPGKRYYAGNFVADKIENLVCDRVKNLFGVPYANVQPYSGSPANLAVYMATCEPGDPIMGLDLLSGGHLTHGWKFSATSKLWTSHPYHLKSDGSFDFDEIRQLAYEHKPKLIWCGATAMPRTIPFAKFAEIADEVGALLVADVSHIAGLIVGGQHESPVPHAHIITTTTHKTLRGPRAALIMVTEKGLSKDEKLGKKIDKAIIPGLQGGPHLNTIAAIGVALNEAAQPEFTEYAARVIENAKTLAEALKERGFKLVSDGTDNHLLLVDMTPTGVGRGKFFHLALERIGLYCNMNSVPGDEGPPLYPSGFRLGSPAATTRGMGTDEMSRVADWIARVAEAIKNDQLPDDIKERPTTFKSFSAKIASDPYFEELQQEVENLCKRFPIPALK
ncbi:MAG: serine hydroxymethyltransferase [Patescibacteria group bacterium]